MEPALLIASPQMRDPFFERALVLVWHHDADGAIGVVVNRELEHTLSEVLDLTRPAEDFPPGKVGWGGPVDTGSGTIVASRHVDLDEGWNLPDGLSITRSQDTLLRLLDQGVSLLLCLGYAGWGPGQLDEELESGAWLSTDCSAEILFHTEAAERYTKALATLGLTEAMLWMRPINE